MCPTRWPWQSVFPAVIYPVNSILIGTGRPVAGSLALVPTAALVGRHGPYNWLKQMGTRSGSADYERGLKTNGLQMQSCQSRSVAAE